MATEWHNKIIENMESVQYWIKLEARFIPNTVCVYFEMGLDHGITAFLKINFELEFDMPKLQIYYHLNKKGHGRFHAWKRLQMLECWISFKAKIYNQM